MSDKRPPAEFLKKTPSGKPFQGQSRKGNLHSDAYYGGYQQKYGPPPGLSTNKRSVGLPEGMDRKTFDRIQNYAAQHALKHAKHLAKFLGTDSEMAHNVLLDAITQAAVEMLRRGKEVSAVGDVNGKKIRINIPHMKFARFKYSRARLPAPIIRYSEADHLLPYKPGEGKTAKVDGYKEPPPGPRGALPGSVNISKRLPRPTPEWTETTGMDELYADARGVEDESPDSECKMCGISSPKSMTDCPTCGSPKIKLSRRNYLRRYNRAGR